MVELAKDEVKNFTLVWITVILSLSYCHSLSNFTKQGLLRLLLILPVVALFLFLPLNLTSVHLTGTTAFFVSWLATFKLLLFSLGRGPLSSHPSLSLPKFIAFACLPIKVRHQTATHREQGTPLNYLVKAILMASIRKVYEFGDRIHPNILWMIYFLHIYLMLELILAVVAVIAKILLGMELEAQFDEPLLASSLQDFWGKRWNLMATRILRLAVYEPVLEVSSFLVGREFAACMAVLSTFVVSGVMHELIFYYMGHIRPTFEVSAFFMLHGVCLCVEIVVKRALGGAFAWRPPRVVSGAATVVFVMVTGVWLFLPPMLRGGAAERAFEEYAVVGTFVRTAIGLIVG